MRFGLGLLVVGVVMIVTSLLFPKATTNPLVVRLFACGIVTVFVGIATSVHYWLKDEPTNKVRRWYSWPLGGNTPRPFLYPKKHPYPITTPLGCR